MLTLLYCILFYLKIVSSYKIVCYWDVQSAHRPGYARFGFNESLRHSRKCTHLILGFGSVDKNNFQLKVPQMPEGESPWALKQFIEIKKADVPIHFGIGCSVFSPHDCDLDAYWETIINDGLRQNFISQIISSINFLQADGVDLSWPFPSYIGRGILSIKITGSQVLYPAAYAAFFKNFIEELAVKLFMINKRLTLTVLPRTNVFEYAINEIEEFLSAIHLLTFDYITPITQPFRTGLTAPLKSTFPNQQIYSVMNTLSMWLHRKIPPHKIVIGLPAFARTWMITASSFSRIDTTDSVPSYGPGMEGGASRIRGLLYLYEACYDQQSYSIFIQNNLYGQWPSIDLLSGESGYYRVGEVPGFRFLWVTHEHPITIEKKVQYLRRYNLGGFGIYDLSSDDFHRTCEQGSLLDNVRYFLG